MSDSNSSIGIRAALAEVEETRSIQVPEWKHPETGEPLLIHWKLLSPAKIARYTDIKAREANARMVAENALDENGEKIFNPGDHITLMKSGHFKTLNRIALAMLGNPEDDDNESTGEGDTVDPLAD